MNNLINRRTKSLALLLLIYKILYDIIIVYLLPIAAADDKIYGLNPNGLKIALGYLFLVLLFPIVNKIFSRINLSSITFFVLFLLYYIPVLSVFGQCDLPYGFFILVNIYWLAIIVCMNLICKKSVNEIVFNGLNVGINKVFFILFIFTVISTYLYNGLSINFELSDVYDVREESLNVNYSLGLIKNAYVMILGAVFISFYLVRKEYIWALFAIILMVVLFSVGKDKSALFIILPIVVLSLFNKIEYSTIKIVVVFCICILMVLSYLEYVSYDSTYMCYFVVRRTFFIPAHFNYLYYDFFSENTKLYLTDHVFILSRLLPDIHPYNVSELISRKYFSGITTSPNTGMFAEGYMQLGILGTIIYPVVFVSFLKFMDRITLYYPLLLKVSTAVATGLIVLNVPITHSHFVVHFGFACIFMVLINTEFKKILSSGRQKSK